MRHLAKRAARFLLGDYRLNRIYSVNLEDLPVKDIHTQLAINQRLGRLEENDFDSAPDERMRNRRLYAGANAYGFGLWEHHVLVCMSWCWNNRRPLGGVWFLSDDEVALVDIITAEHHRGKGLASIVTHFAAQELKKQGVRRLYAWIWHSHRSSIRSFEKAGWKYVAFVAELDLLNIKHLRLVRNIAS